MGGRTVSSYPVHIWGLTANATWSRANEQSLVIITDYFSIPPAENVGCVYRAMGI